MNRQNSEDNAPRYTPVGPGGCNERGKESEMRESKRGRKRGGRLTANTSSLYVLKWTPCNPPLYAATAGITRDPSAKDLARVAEDPPRERAAPRSEARDRFLVKRNPAKMARSTLRKMGQSNENIWMFPTRERHGRRKGPVSVSKG